SASNYTSTPPHSTLSLHDALPISRNTNAPTPPRGELAPESWTGLILGREGVKGLIPILHRGQALESLLDAFSVVPPDVLVDCLRSEEHTSELQSRFDLVCRLLLEK